MRLALLLLLALVAMPAWGVIDGVPVQSAQRFLTAGTGAGTVTSGEGWSTPTTGNLIIVGVGYDNDATPQTTHTLTGYTLLQDHIAASFAVGGALYCRVSDGTESTVAFSLSNGIADGRVVAFEFDSTDLNADCSTVISAENTANVGTVGTSQSSGSAANTTTNALAIAVIVNEGANVWGGITYTNSFIERFDPTGSAHAGVWLATKVVSSVASQSTLLEASTGSGQRSWGAIAVVNSGSPPTGITDAAPVPGQTVTYTCGIAFISNITTMTTVNGDTISAEAGAGTCTADFIIPALPAYVAAGSMNNTRWASPGTWTVGNGVTTQNISMQITPPAGFFGQLACSPASDCPGGSLFVAPAVATDDYYANYTVGAGQFNDYGVFEAVGDTATIEVRAYSSGEWSAIVEHVFGQSIFNPFRGPFDLPTPFSMLVPML